MKITETIALKDSPIYKELSEKELNLILSMKDNIEGDSDIMVSRETCFSQNMHHIFLTNSRAKIAFARFKKEEFSFFFSDDNNNLRINDDVFNCDFNVINLFLSTFKNISLEITQDMHCIEAVLHSTQFKNGKVYFDNGSLDYFIDKISFINSRPNTIDRYSEERELFINGRKPRKNELFVIKDSKGYKAKDYIGLYSKTDDINKAKVFKSDYSEHDILCSIVHNRIEREHDRIAISIENIILEEKQY